MWKRSTDKNGWNAYPGCGSDLSVAHDGTVYVIGKDKLVYMYDKDEKGWTRITGVKNAVRVDGLSKT